jgi:hypothetical protein
MRDPFVGREVVIVGELCVPLHSLREFLGKVLLRLRIDFERGLVFPGRAPIRVEVIKLYDLPFLRVTDDLQVWYYASSSSSLDLLALLEGSPPKILFHFSLKMNYRF